MCVWWSSRVLMNVIWKLWLFCALAIVCTSNPHVVGSSIRPSSRPSVFRYQCENFHLQFPQSETKKEPSRAASLIQKGQLLWQTIIFPIISRNKDFFLTTKFSRVISIISAGMTRGVGNTEIVVEIAEINRQKVCVCVETC